MRSAVVMKGYWKDPALTPSTIDADGWLSTGDLGAWDEGDNLRIVGRRVEMYIRGASMCTRRRSRLYSLSTRI